MFEAALPHLSLLAEHEPPGIHEDAGATATSASSSNLVMAMSAFHSGKMYPLFIRVETYPLPYCQWMHRIQVQSIHTTIEKMGGRHDEMTEGDLAVSSPPSA